MALWHLPGPTAPFGDDTKAMLSKKITVGTAWLFLTSITTNFIGFIGQLILARILVPEDFGIYALALAVMNVISAFLELPVSMALIQMEEPTKDDYSTAFTVGLIRGAVVCLLILALAWPMALLFTNSHLGPLLALLSVYPLILSFRNPYFMTFAREISFSEASILEVTSKVTAFIITVAVAVIYKTYWAFPAGLMVSAVVEVILSFVIARQIPGFSLKSLRQMWDFSIWLGLTTIVNQLNFQSNRFVVGWFFPAATLGHYHMSQQISIQLTRLLVNPFTRSLFSAFSVIQNDPHRLRHAYRKAQSFVGVIVLPAGFGIAAVAEPLILLLLGEQWRPAILFVRFTAPVLALSTIYSAVVPLAMAMARTKTLFYRNVVATCIKLPLLTLGVIYGGILWFLIMTVVTAVFVTAVNMVLVRELVDVKFWQQATLNIRQLAATLIMVGIVLMIDHVLPPAMNAHDHILHLGVMCSTGIAVYFSILLLLWSLAGRPDGPEATGLSTAGKVVTRVRRKLAA